MTLLTALPPLTRLLASLSGAALLAACAAAPSAGAGPLPATGAGSDAGRSERATATAAATATATPTTTTAASSAELFQQLRAEIGEPRCSSNAQCRSVAVGHKSCGGPDSYLAWSTAVSDETRLARLVAAHADARRREDAASGRVSNCAMLLDPGARCEAERCVLNTRGGTPPVMR